MHRTWVKICGVRDPETAAAAAEAGADAIGLVFAPGTPRVVTVEQAKAVTRGLPRSVAAVGLFVNAEADEIRRVCGAAGIGTVQLHGSETREFAESLAPLRVIKAMGYSGDAVERVAEWKGCGNLMAMMWDAPGSGGGKGKAWDWSAVRVKSEVPMIIAGGLTPGSVGAVVRAGRPWGVDVSSGVESSRGIKDIALVRKFCEAVREADAES